MGAIGVWAAFLVLPLFVTVAARPDVLPPDVTRIVAPGATHYKVVVVAGDGRLPVFDNAVDGIEARMRERASDPGDIQRLSAAAAVIAKPGVLPATLDNLLRAVSTMKPAEGESCLVFATSHGGEGRGLWLQMTGEYLTPQALDHALSQGCGNAPTAVVISGCFTGIFAQPPMTRANRVVLTAARADRTSFGCGAGRVYTAYDKCLLAALDQGGTWAQAYDQVRICVSAEEQVAHEVPSEPQAFFGSWEDDMPLPDQTGSAQP